MKGVVLSGGKGTRLRPVTYSVAKQLVPIGGEPILFYGLRDLAAAGVTEVVIVISPETGDQVRRAIAGAGLGVDVAFVVQPEPNGLAAALGTALPLVGDDDCILVLGDVVASGGIQRTLDDFASGDVSCQLLVTEVENPEAFGIAELDASGAIERLVEKPANPRSNLAIAGVYAFDRQIGDAIDAIEPSDRGEYEITDAIQHLLETGRRVRPTATPSWWKDTGNKRDLLEANRLVLDEAASEVAGSLESTQMTGTLRLGEGSVLERCRVIGPASVGSGVHAENVTIGPYASIGSGGRLRDAVVEDSIVMDRVTLREWKLRNTLLGPDVSLQPPGPAVPVQLDLGEGASIG